MTRYYFALRARLRSLLTARRADDQLDEDIRFHLEEAAAEYRADGLSPEAARRAALGDFGNPLPVKEAVHDGSARRWVERLSQDLRYAGRGCRRTPAFTATAIASLALGIGATTAVFTLLDAVLLRPLPVSHPEQLVLVNPSSDFSYPHYTSFRDGSRVLTDLIAASRPTTVSVAAGDGVEQATAKMVSGNYFTGLGVPPAAGRVFSEADEREPLAVISHRYWLARFGGAADLPGRLVRIDGIPFTVIGVTPRGFLGEAAGEAPDVWASIALQVPARRDERGYSWLNLLGRLTPGATPEQAEAEMNALLATSPIEGTHHLDVVAGGRGVATLRATFGEPLLVLMGVSSVVLLIACTNVGGLLLTRGAARQAEIAMRLALGASRARVVRQLMTESVLLAVVAAALGVALAGWGTRALVHLVSSGGRTITLDLGPDWRVVTFTAAIALATAVVFGLAPAWRAVRHAGIERISEGGRCAANTASRWGVRDAFIVAQLALSLVLLAAGALFTRSLHNLENEEAGFQASDVLLVQIRPERGHRPAVPALIPRLVERVQAIPGVRSASIAFNGPLGTGSGVNGLEIDGFVPQGPQDRRARADWVGPDYLRTAGIALVEGRDFSLADTVTSPRVAIVNETMARFYFAGGTALGRRFVFNEQPYEIVGIARDVKYTDLRDTVPRFVYFAVMQGGAGPSALIVRAAGDHAAVAAAARAAIREVDPRLSAGETSTLSMRLRRALVREHMLADLAGFFSALTLLLVSIGVYGTLSYSAARRTKELGIRLALGSRRAAVVWLVLRGVLVRLAAGLAAGLAAVVAGGRLIESMLFGLSPMDPATLAVVATALLIVALAAGYLPARRAARLDPAAVLRE